MGGDPSSGHGVIPGDGTRPAARIALLSAALVALSMVMIADGVMTRPASPAPLQLPWWVIALVCIGAELLVFHIEINHEAHTFTFSEVPMALGLCLASPMSLVVGRLAGSATALIGIERQRATKVLFNLSMYLAECCVALAVFDAIAAGRPVTNPLVWVATAAAVFTADALSIACVALAIRWHGAEPRPLQLLLAGSVTASANTSLGLVAALLLWTNVAAVSLLAVIAAVLILAYRAYASLAQRHESLQLFYDYTKAVSSSMRADSAIEAMLGKTRELLRSDTAIVVLAGDDAVHPAVRVESRRATPTITMPAVALIEESWLAARVVGEGHVVTISRSTSDPREQAVLDRLGSRDAMIGALRGEAGVLGVIIVADRMGEVSSYDAESARLFEILSSHTGVALENGRLIEELNREVADREYQAEHDSLTGLPNRVLFFDRIAAQVEADDGPFSILLMDLDGFKEINDTLGHESGDLVLQEVARRLTRSTPVRSTVARLGGDEFAILLPHVASDPTATIAAGRLNAMLEEPMHIGGVALETRSSIGIAHWPTHAADGSSLVKCADVAMYSAKATASRVECYDASRDEHTLERLALGAQLRDAITHGDLVVHYQPLTRMHDGAVTGAEALVRWHHPEHGMMPPDEFIAVAERTGSIGPLTRFVLRRALEECARWRRRGYELTIAVNLSVASLLDADLPAQVEQLLRSTRTRPEWLTLEITESGIMDPRRGRAALEQLAAIGVRIAIDDFGTGYSSLSYLARLPVHELKIDQSFVRAMATEPQSASIVRTVVDLGESLGLTVVAEGIEDRVTWDHLRAAGCHVAQGYYVSRPISDAAFMAWLAATNVATAQPLVHS